MQSQFLVLFKLPLRWPRRGLRSRRSEGSLAGKDGLGFAQVDSGGGPWTVPNIGGTRKTRGEGGGRGVAN